MDINKRQQGNEGEDLAVSLLVSKGYEILERNYHFGNKGEIDIIAKDPETGYTAFIEVKFRKSLEYGEPEYAITNSKKSQIRKIALGYLFEKEIGELDCRFDVITVLKLPKQAAKIDHYINAFE